MSPRQQQDRLLYPQYRQQGEALGFRPLLREDPAYPQLLRSRLGDQAPEALWALGDLSLLEKPAVALVGSRDLFPENRDFASQVGRMAASMGFVLVSGNARGADREAQDTCLRYGGQVISVVADKLSDHKPQPNILYVSEEAYDLGFSARRALSRNRVIHCLGAVTFVAQSNVGRGGTWDGTMKNLRGHWSPVFCCQDGREAVEEFVFRGATAITIDDIGRVLYEQSR